jgi:hypothetical protein
MTLSTSTPDTSDAIGTDRRRLLIGGVVATAVATALAACGDDSDDDKATSTSTTAAAGGGGSASSEGDLAIATLAAGLEVLLVETYGAALVAAVGGKLGDVPMVVATYATTAKANHTEHLAAWNGILKAAGRPAVTAPNAMIKPMVDAGFAKVKDIAGVATMSLMLEQAAAQTYLTVIPKLAGKAAIRKAGEILIIDQQHQAILLYALGKYPVPEAFLATDKALPS